MEKIKICHISQPVSGGVFTHLSNLSEHLNSDKFEQTYIFSSDYKFNTSFQGKKVITIPMKRKINLFKDIYSLLKIYNHIKKNNIELVHCHSSKAGVLGRIAAKLAGVPKIIYTPHSFAFNIKDSKLKVSLYKLIERALARITNKIICVSNGEFEQAQKEKIAPLSRLNQINNGVTLNGKSYSDLRKKLFLSKNNLPNYKNIILFVGRLSEQKNPAMILQALVGLDQLDYLLIYLGEGELKENLQDLANKHHLKNVIFLGNVDNVYNFLSISDLFANTSYYEGMPYAILEAVNAEVPVIATDIFGNNDIILDGITGALVKVNDIKALRELLIKFNNNREVFEKRTFQAKECLKKNYNVKKMIKEIEALYSQI